MWIDVHTANRRRLWGPDRCWENMCVHDLVIWISILTWEYCTVSFLGVSSRLVAWTSLVTNLPIEGSRGDLKTGRREEDKACDVPEEKDTLVYQGGRHPQEDSYDEATRPLSASSCLLQAVIKRPTWSKPSPSCPLSDKSNAYPTSPSPSHHPSLHHQHRRQIYKKAKHQACFFTAAPTVQ